MRTIDFHIEGTSPLHRMHPSVKFILFLAFFIFVNLLRWDLRWIFSLTFFLLLWSCGLHPGKYKVFLLLLVFADMTVPILHAFGGSTPIVTVWKVTVYKEGLIKGLDFGGLYTAIGFITMTVILTTKPWEFSEALSILKAPPTWGFAVSYALRYAPEMLEHYLELVDVWKTRGVNFEKGPFWSRFWLQGRLLVALLTLELARVKTKSNAIEMRGFSGEGSRRPTLFILNPISKPEKVLVILVWFPTLVLCLYKILGILHVL